MLITMILDQPGSPWSTSVHHSSLGLGTVDQGVTSQKHPARPRLALGVRGWARQRPEASCCLASDNPEVKVGTGWLQREYGWSRS